MLKSQKEKGKSVVISASINILVQNMNERVHQTLNSLNKSAFRSKFRLTQKDRDYIASKGLKTIEDHAFQFINSRVAPDFPRNDGKCNKSYIGVYFFNFSSPSAIEGFN